MLMKQPKVEGKLILSKEFFFLQGVHVDGMTM